MSVNGDEQFSSAIGIIARGHADIGKEVGGWEEVSSNSKDFCYARLGVSKVIIFLLSPSSLIVLTKILNDFAAFL